jgi:ATP-dependent Clp protease ATP-binding subunit ClpB
MKAKTALQRHRREAAGALRRSAGPGTTTEGESAMPGKTGAKKVLNPVLKSPEAHEFEQRLLSMIIGQEHACHQIAHLYQVFLAGLTPQDRPVGNFLFLGPTGTGKTRIIEASSEILFGTPRAVIKIDCAEFSHSHEISKLIGSPPGYLGHRETTPYLSQENIDRYCTEDLRLALILFDEIEKASDSLWSLLLGILDKGTLTLGDNRTVDMSHCIIFMTGNIGSDEVAHMMNGGIGFNSPPDPRDARLHRRVNSTVLDAAKRKFSPEFMNRIDNTVVFHSLSQDHLKKILDLELSYVQQRIDTSPSGRRFSFRASPRARKFLLQEGTSNIYGARHLKRAIERYLVYPLSNLASTGQVEHDDVVQVDFRKGKKELVFSKTVRNTVPVA